MQSLSSKQNFFIGLSLATTSSHDSSICVLDRNSKIILIDKFYFVQDMEYFFETSPYIKDCALCASIAYDNRLLEGKWRIHSKNYKVLGDNFKINRDNWTNRISNRLSEGLLKLKQRGIEVIRCDINQLRMAYGLSAHYLERTSIDCKNLQTALKLKYNFSQMPDNMLSASSLEAIICAMFAMDYVNNVETKKVQDVFGIDFLARKVN